MTKLGTVEFAGKSGNKYSFNAYEWGTAFKKDYGAVYYITKRAKDANGKFEHTKIYVGETGDLSTRFDNHHKQDCFDENGVNCVCIRGEADETTRLEIEADLLGKHEPSCNG